MSEWDHYRRTRPSIGEMVVANAFFLFVVLALVGIPVAVLAAIIRRFA